MEKETKAEVAEVPLSAMMCLDMNAYELVDRVKEAIVAVAARDGYKFHKSEVFHVERDGITTLDASGAFYAHFMDLKKDALIEKPSDYQEYLPTSRFLTESRDMERLTTLVLSISEMHAEVVFTMLSLPRNETKLAALTEFEKPKFREFTVPDPEEDFNVYIKKMGEFSKYVKDNALFKDWENRA